MTDHHSVVDGLQSIVVLRPNAVGDFMFSVPAIHALRHTYPDAHITFLGKQWHADFLQNRPSPINEVIVMPLAPGVGAPLDAELDKEANERFIADMQARRFDLAIQMYGGGRYSNPYIKQFKAKLTIGLKAPDAEPLDRWLPYSTILNRRLELLQLVSLVGAVPPLLDQEITVTEEDTREAEALLPFTHGERIVVLHPGATDVRRHWPAERFAAVGDALASRGATIVISATPVEAHLAKTIVDNMRFPALDFTGRLSLSALCGLLDRASMMVSNDTGPLHMAFGIGTPSVGIYWLTNLLEAGPLRPHLLRPAMSVRVNCPVCGQDNRNERCPHDLSFVDDVTTEEVIALALGLFAETA